MEPLASYSKEQLLALISEQAATLQQLRTVLQEQAEALQRARQEITALQQEIARLNTGGPPKKPVPSAPEWVKPNTPVPDPSAPKPARKKRARNFTFKRREPTHTIEHTCACCPECGRALSGGWEYSRRQLIEVPPLAVEVIDHVVLARHCGVCAKNCVPRVDYTQQAVGRCHYGPRLLSLLAYLRMVGRLPKQSIQGLLEALFGLHLGLGEISRLLHLVARQGQEVYAGLRQQLQASAYAHGDETGWRENGQNGYVWSFCRPDVRYFVYDSSRSHAVPERVLGTAYPGVLVSDFYGGYNYHLGLHQRCWVHLLRDLHALKQQYPTEGVLRWTQQVRDLYDRAKAFSAECAQARRAARLRFQAEALELGVPYVNAALPQSVLAARLVQFEAELFTFVEYPQVPSENNAAERAIRPRVIARKISGGTRSPTGSATMAVLASLFETWRVRGEDCLEACRQMLIASQRSAAAPAS